MKYGEIEMCRRKNNEAVVEAGVDGRSWRSQVGENRA